MSCSRVNTSSVIHKIRIKFINCRFVRKSGKDTKDGNQEDQDVAGKNIDFRKILFCIGDNMDFDFLWKVRATDW